MTQTQRLRRARARHLRVLQVPGLSGLKPSCWQAASLCCRGRPGACSLLSAGCPQSLARGPQLQGRPRPPSRALLVDGHLGLDWVHAGDPGDGLGIRHERLWGALVYTRRFADARSCLWWSAACSCSTPHVLKAGGVPTQVRFLPFIPHSFFVFFQSKKNYLNIHVLFLKI